MSENYVDIMFWKKYGMSLVAYFVSSALTYLFSWIDFDLPAGAPLRGLIGISQTMSTVSFLFIIPVIGVIYLTYLGVKRIKTDPNPPAKRNAFIWGFTFPTIGLSLPFIYAIWSGPCTAGPETCQIWFAFFIYALLNGLLILPIYIIIKVFYRKATKNYIIEK